MLRTDRFIDFFFLREDLLILLLHDNMYKIYLLQFGILPCTFFFCKSKISIIEK